MKGCILAIILVFIASDRLQLMLNKTKGGRWIFETFLFLQRPQLIASQTFLGSTLFSTRSLVFYCFPWNLVCLIRSFPSSYLASSSIGPCIVPSALQGEARQVPSCNYFFYFLPSLSSRFFRLSNPKGRSDNSCKKQSGPLVGIIGAYLVKMIKSIAK